MIRLYGEDYISAQDAADRYHYTVEHIQGLVRLNKVRGLKKQGMVFVHKGEMHAYAQRHVEATIKQRLERRTN